MPRYKNSQTEIAKARCISELENAWNERDREMYDKAYKRMKLVLEKEPASLLKNPFFRFSIQKLINRTTLDKSLIKEIESKSEKKKFIERLELKREPVEKFYGKLMNFWFDKKQYLKEDLLVSTHQLDLAFSRRINYDEELLDCLEIVQFFVAMRKDLLWNETISAEQLKADLYQGLEGFRRSTYKMIANLFETAIQEKEHERVLHFNARLSEFPISEHTLSELVRAFFVGNEKMSNKKDCAPRKKAGTKAVASDAQQEEKEVDDDEEMESDKSVEPMEYFEEEEKAENQQEMEELNLEDSKENIQKRVFSLFKKYPNLHIYQWDGHHQLEILYLFKKVVQNLPSFQEMLRCDSKITGFETSMELSQQQLSNLTSEKITKDVTRHPTRKTEEVIDERPQLEKQLDDSKKRLESKRKEAARQRDDLERIYRIVEIGSDRHLRKYYWFKYGSDAGIWIQDYGRTEYEKWVTTGPEVSPDDNDWTASQPHGPVSPKTSHAWFKLETRAEIQRLKMELMENGQREAVLHGFIEEHFKEIVESLKEKRECLRDDEGHVAEVERESSEESIDVVNEDPIPSENADDEPNTHQQVSRFTGSFVYLKHTISDFLSDWKESGSTKISDVKVFEAKLHRANDLKEMKRLVIELITSIPDECLMIAKRCGLNLDNFLPFVNSAVHDSTLHLLIEFFGARIDQKKTLQEMPCHVCRKNESAPKFTCEKCATVYHPKCLFPELSRGLFEEENMEKWPCLKCRNIVRRRELILAKEQREKEERTEKEEIQLSRGGSAKRKTIGVVLRNTPALPTPKRQKTDVPLSPPALNDTVVPLSQQAPIRRAARKDHSINTILEVQEDHGETSDETRGFYDAQEQEEEEKDDGYAQVATHTNQASDGNDQGGKNESQGLAYFKGAMDGFGGGGFDGVVGSIVSLISQGGDDSGGGLTNVFSSGGMESIVGNLISSESHKFLSIDPATGAINGAIAGNVIFQMGGQNNSLSSIGKVVLDNIISRKFKRDIQPFTPGGQVSGLGSQQQFQTINFQEERQKCLQQKILFKDPQFPANGTSLYYKTRPDETIIWKRPGEIYENPQLIVGEKSRFGVKQGSLGDSWLLAAIANLTLRDELFYRVVPPDQSFTENYAGIFHFQFWRYGQWVDVVIDDRLPTVDGKLCYMRSQENHEFWSALLEKAYAKLYGGYENLDGGTTAEALEDFTGGLTEFLDLEKDDKATILAMLVRGMQMGSLFGCSIGAAKNVKEAQLTNGLVREHAYSITAIQTVNQNSDQIPLLRIRNPWGNSKEWNGAWSDESAEWKQVDSRQREQISVHFAKDDGFWMSLDDFMHNFTQMECCHLSADVMNEISKMTGVEVHDKQKHQWVEKSEDGEWNSRQGTAGGCQNNDTYCNNPQYGTHFQVPHDSVENDGKCTVIAAVLQKYRREMRSKNLDNLAIGFSVYQAQSDPLSTVFGQKPIARTGVCIKEREVTARFRVSPGQYVIIPCTFGADDDASFFLRVFSNAEFQIKLLR